jgi:hypothetical protein
VQAVGGVGGSVACSVAGGEGGTGLIRIDRPDGEELETDPAPVPGPAFVMDDQVIAKAGPDLAIAIRGKPGSSYKVRVTGFDRDTNAEAVSSALVATPKGTGEATVSLRAGHNELCVEADPATTYPESQNCLTIAYLP